MAFREYGLVVGVILAVVGSVLLFQPALIIPNVPDGIGILAVVLFAAGIGLIAQYGK